jgi:hypothetical protein
MPEEKFIKITNITKQEEKVDVYNMEVEKYHNFSVNNGLIIHNCIDALRYAFNEYMNVVEFRVRRL